MSIGPNAANTEARRAAEENCMTRSTRGGEGSAGTTWIALMAEPRETATNNAKGHEEEKGCGGKNVGQDVATALRCGGIGPVSQGALRDPGLESNDRVAVCSEDFCCNVFEQECWKNGVFG